MKKTWIVALSFLSTLLILQQVVFSRESVRPVLLSQTTPIGSSLITSAPVITLPISQSSTPVSSTGALFLTPPTTSDMKVVITVSTYLPDSTAPAGTPSGTLKPTDSLTNTAAGFGSSDGATGGSHAPSGDNISPPVTTTPVVDTTPKANHGPSGGGISPTFPPLTPFVPEAPNIHLAPTNTPTPTITPTPTSVLPPALTAGTEKTKEKTTTTLDTSVLADIVIIPNAVAAEKGPTDKPLLPQEKQQLAANSGTPPGGIIVTLEQKKGSSFVTRQDELTVKRGDQLYTITNQPTINSQTKTLTAPRLAIDANNVIAQSDMGVSVDPLNGILAVNTPSGPQRVSIMPDEALGIVVELNALMVKNAVAAPSILLSNDKGALVYQISGEKVERFLGLFSLPIQKQITVSVDTGSVVKVQLSPWYQFLSFFTF